MSETKIKWLPSYSLMITKNILNKLGVHIASKDLLVALEKEDSPYRELCRVPMLNIFNNLILAQIKSYQEFIQKRLIDYFVQNNPTKQELDLLGKEQVIPESVTNSKEYFLSLKKNTQLIEQQLLDNIAISQAYLIAFVRKQHGNFTSQLSDDFLHRLSEFSKQSNQIQQSLVVEKNQWRELTTNISNLLSELGNFRINEVEDLEQRAELQFLQNLGEM